MNVTDVIYYQSTLMVDSTDGATFNKCDPVRVRISSTVSAENRLFCTNCKNFKQISTNKINDTYIHE